MLLAYSSDAVVRDFLSADSFVKYTDVTITSRAAYKEELVKVRQKGYAVDDEEEEPGVSRPQSTWRVDVGPECDRRHRPDRPENYDKLAGIVKQSSARISRALKVL